MRLISKLIFGDLRLLFCSSAIHMKADLVLGKCLPISASKTSWIDLLVLKTLATSFYLDAVWLSNWLILLLLCYLLFNTGGDWQNGVMEELDQFVGEEIRELRCDTF